MSNATVLQRPGSPGATEAPGPFSRWTRLVRTAWRYARAGRTLDLPLQAGFAVNNTCNTFCTMCNVWRERPKAKLSLEEIRRIFTSSLFARCATLSMTGGEPTMREDFSELPIVLAECMPSLTNLAVTTNGYATEKIVSDFSSFLPLLRKKSIAFSVNVSIDGVGETHDLVRGNERAFEHLDATIDSLNTLRKKHPFNLVLACTLSRLNASCAPGVLEYARSKGLYIIFRNAFTINRIDNLHTREQYVLTEEQLLWLKEFYRKTLLPYDRSHSRSRYYRMLLRMMDGGERDIPCLYRRAGLFVDHRGDMYVCTVFSERIGNALEGDPVRTYLESRRHREELACSDCRRCSHDVTLFPSVVSQAWDRLRSRITGVRR